MVKGKMNTIHEYGDEFYRPTNAAWKCPNCGTKLYTVLCIQSHKARCTTKVVEPTQVKQKIKFVSPTGKVWEIER